jgi:uncharacterized membrane protein YecN with MAPEG domain
MFAHALLISPLYVGFFALMLVVLGIMVIRLRSRHGVAYGDGSRADLKIATRIHGNFIEYVPLGLLVIVLVEAAGYSPYWVHGLGIAFVVGRLAHAQGLTRKKQPSPGRMAGVILTFAVLGIGGAALIVTFVRATGL